MELEAVVEVDVDEGVAGLVGGHEGVACSAGVVGVAWSESFDRDRGAGLAVAGAENEVKVVAVADGAGDEDVGVGGRRR